MAIKLLSSDITPKANAVLLMVEEPEKRIVDMALLGPEPRAHAMVQPKKPITTLPHDQTTLKMD